MPLSSAPSTDGAIRPGLRPAPSQVARRVTAARWAPVLVAVLFAALQLAGYSSYNFSNDSYRYAAISLHFLGDSPKEARTGAVKAYCANEAARAASSQLVDPNRYAAPSPRDRAYRDCVSQNRHGLQPKAAEYQRIFDTRPGYPLLVAPAVAVLGVLKGMWVMDLAITLASAFAVIAVLRAVGLGRSAALAGQVVFLASPLSYWSMRPLSDGLVTLCVLGTMYGGWQLLQGRTLRGAAVFLGSFAALGLTKYSTAMMVALGFVAVGLALAVLGRRRFPVRKWGFVGLSALTVVAVAALSAALSLPGTSATLQDTFTNHFAEPPVPDPWQRLVQLNLHYWVNWIGDQARDPLFLAAAIAAGWALARHARLFGWLCLAIGAVGLGAAVAHPVANQGPRLWLMAWIPVVLGFAVLVDRWCTREEQEAASLLPVAEPVAAS